MSSVPARIIVNLIDISARYNLAGTDFRLLLFLALQEGGEVCDTMPDLAEQLQIPLRTLRRSTARLEEMGLIRRNSGRGRIITCLRLADGLLAPEEPEGEDVAPAPPGGMPDGGENEEGTEEIVDTLARFIAQSLPNMPITSARSLAASEFYAPLIALLRALRWAQESHALRVSPGRDVFATILAHHLAALETPQ